MKKTLLFFIITFWTGTIMAQHISSGNTWIAEFNEEIPATYRDENGKIHLYFMIAGLADQTMTQYFIDNMRMFRFVQNAEIYQATPFGVIFHLQLHPNATLAQIQKMFYSLNIWQVLFFEQFYEVDQMTNDIIQSKFTL